MTLELPTYHFCPQCGLPVDLKDIHGRRRPVCSEGHIIYFNPLPAATLVLIDRGQVLLTLRDVDPHRGEWCLPGGFIEWGESPEDGGRRELLEETGITAGALKLVGLYDSISQPDRHVILAGFRVMDWTGEPVAGDDAADVGWFPLNNMPQLAFQSHRRLLAEATANGGRQ